MHFEKIILAGIEKALKNFELIHFWHYISKEVISFVHVYL